MFVCVYINTVTARWMLISARNLYASPQTARGIIARARAPRTHPADTRSTFNINLCFVRRPAATWVVLFSCVYVYVCVWRQRRRRRRGRGPFCVCVCVRAMLNCKCVYHHNKHYSIAAAERVRFFFNNNIIFDWCVRKRVVPIGLFGLVLMFICARDRLDIVIVFFFEFLFIYLFIFLLSLFSTLIRSSCYLYGNACT